MKKYAKAVAFLLVFLLLAWMASHLGWQRYFDPERLQSLVQTHYAETALLYIVLTVVGCVALALPGVTFAAAAGILFGPWMGTLLCLTATTLGAMAAFLMGRFFLKEAIGPWVRRNAYLNRMLFSGARKNALFLLMVTRLVPLFPYNLQSFAYGVTDIGFGPYSLYTFIFMLPGVALFTVGTAGLTDADNRLLYFTIAAVLFLLVTGVGIFLRKKYLKEEEPDEK